MERDIQEVYDVVGVGVGPFNLSVAALLHPIDSFLSCFLEGRPEFQWHPGMLFPESTIQTSYLKDLVTPADPTNPYSFISFLFAQKRFYRFLNANFPRVTRKEFNQYLQWVCDKLSTVRFGCRVRAVSLERGLFRIDTDKMVLHAKDIILGTGLTPFVPPCTNPHLCSTVFHATEFLTHTLQLDGKRIAVIGGGQSGAEVVLHLLSNSGQNPEKISWISRRFNFLPLDESPFTNELFTPSYANYFFNLPFADRCRILHDQHMASDGIAPSLLEQLYQKMYTREFIEKHLDSFCLLPQRELKVLRPTDSGWELGLENHPYGIQEWIGADIIVLCTGYTKSLPAYLAPLTDRIPRKPDGFDIRSDYSIVWDGPSERRIYMQNGAKHTHGIADPNLSLMAWRSATIINSLVGTRVYEVPEDSPLIAWTTPEGKLDIESDRSYQKQWRFDPSYTKIAKQQEEEKSAGIM